MISSFLGFMFRRENNLQKSFHDIVSSVFCIKFCKNKKKESVERKSSWVYDFISYLDPKILPLRCHYRQGSTCECSQVLFLNQVFVWNTIRKLRKQLVLLPTREDWTWSELAWEEPIWLPFLFLLQQLIIRSVFSESLGRKIAMNFLAPRMISIVQMMLAANKVVIWL